MIKLKNILSEGYAWERQEGKPLPTLKDVQEAYDAKGIEEAEDSEAKPDYIDLDKDGNEEESMKKAAKDAKEVNEEETEEEADHAANDAGETLDVLNMGSLEESNFWGRVKGNLHGHEYILREAFKK